MLCPDNAYDRSPCGTGSSARLAEGEEIIQQSVIGSTYRLSYRKRTSGGIIPSITGQAYVMAQSTLIFHPDDPFRNGIRMESSRTDVLEVQHGPIRNL